MGDVITHKISEINVVMSKMVSGRGCTNGPERGRAKEKSVFPLRSHRCISSLGGNLSTKSDQLPPDDE